MLLFIKKLLSALVLVHCTTRLSAFIHDNDIVESVEPEIEKRALPALKWDGVCPKKVGSCPTSFQGKTPLILVSLDGFHPDYINRGITKTIKNIGECGTNARFMYPVFPSKTYPNHYSQVTGLNPASHGIIDNSMYDPSSRKMFKFGRPEALESFWWQKEPIWITARKQGKIAATYYWPGSDVVINGSTPNIFMKYRPGTTFEERVDQVLAWLDLPQSSRPDLMTLYVNQPDNAAHHYGLKSKQIDSALVKVDRMISRLFSGLQQRNLLNCVNVVIVSDHGMSDIDCKRVVDLQKFIEVSDVVIGTAGPFSRIKPRGKRNITLNNQLISKLSCRSPHMRVYPKEQLPVRMHFVDNSRIEPIFLDLDAGWTVVSKNTDAQGEICTGAAHGYDNLFPEMRGIFIAHGPAFKKNYTTRSFISTELYEMFAELLNVRPNPNNGTKGSLHHIMTSPKALESQVEPDSPAVGVIPEDEMEYYYRIYASNCSCSKNSKRQVQAENIGAIRDKHLPFGVPYSPEDNNTLRFLYNEDYTAAFDLKYRLPMWASFTLKGKINISKTEDVCWKGDARISIYDAANCGDYDKAIVKKNYILQRPLYSPGFSNASNMDQASYVTNSIPKSLNYTNILEDPMNKLLAKWTSQSGELNIVTGPAFDLYATGVRPPIGRLMKLHEKTGPLVASTHIFVVATWCKTKKSSLKDCAASKMDAHAFLLPNEPYVNNCETAETVIARNSARVVDVEKLTGLSFYTGLPIYDAIRLRTVMPERSL